MARSEDHKNNSVKSGKCYLKQFCMCRFICYLTCGSAIHCKEKSDEKLLKMENILP